MIVGVTSEQDRHERCWSLIARRVKEGRPMRRAVLFAMKAAISH